MEQVEGLVAAQLPLFRARVCVRAQRGPPAWTERSSRRSESRRRHANTISMNLSLLRLRSNSGSSQTEPGNFIDRGLERVVDDGTCSVDSSARPGLNAGTSSAKGCGATSPCSSTKWSSSKQSDTAAVDKSR
eukprot:6185137-Pleurochrysis_carterae.AAC.1